MNTSSDKLRIILFLPFPMKTSGLYAELLGQIEYYIGGRMPVVDSEEQYVIDNITFEDHRAGYIAFTLWSHRLELNNEGELYLPEDWVPGEYSMLIEHSGNWQIFHHPRKVSSGERI